ncbi:hypothetical protein [Azospirillum rugosum]|uniref:hypothetical protein n=1 Tax=Azospirillum rugosum TaxID=416170 RepID=UPI0036075724
MTGQLDFSRYALEWAESAIGGRCGGVVGRWHRDRRAALEATFGVPPVGVEVLGLARRSLSCMSAAAERDECRQQVVEAIRAAMPETAHKSVDLALLRDHGYPEPVAWLATLLRGRPE